MYTNLLSLYRFILNISWKKKTLAHIAVMEHTDNFTLIFKMCLKKKKKKRQQQYIATRAVT